MNETQVIQALLLCKGVSRKTVYKVYNCLLSFSNPDEVLRVLYEVLRNKNDLVHVDSFEAKLDQAKDMYQSVVEQGIKVISITDSLYPERFRLIDDPPAILYYKGDISTFETSKNIAVIGTREPTNHGAKIAERLGIQFAEKGCNVISGLAIGCDTLAHRGCIKGGGKTLAVLPGGLDNVYPSSNRELAEKILESGGALISEYAPGIKPFKGYYIERDRLQSAFSEVVVVVETDVQGGTMHTVNFAKQQNKIIAAYKHPPHYSCESKCQGNIKLIESGDAISVDSEASIVEIAKLADIKRNSIYHPQEDKQKRPEQMRFF